MQTNLTLQNYNLVELKWSAYFDNEENNLYSNQPLLREQKYDTCEINIIYLIYTIIPSITLKIRNYFDICLIRLMSIEILYFCQGLRIINGIVRFFNDKKMF